MSVELEFLLPGARSSLPRNLGVRGREWPPSKTGGLPAGRDRLGDGTPRPLYQRASVPWHPLDLCSARLKHPVTAVPA